MTEGFCNQQTDIALVYWFAERFVSHISDDVGGSVLQKRVCMYEYFGFEHFVTVSLLREIIYTFNEGILMYLM